VTLFSPPTKQEWQDRLQRWRDHGEPSHGAFGLRFPDTPADPYDRGPRNLVTDTVTRDGWTYRKTTQRGQPFEAYRFPTDHPEQREALPADFDIFNPPKEPPAMTTTHTPYPGNIAAYRADNAAAGESAEGKPLIYAAIAAILARVGPIAKANRNQHQGYRFRGIDDVYNALHPLLAEHKVFVAPEVTGCKVVERESSNGTALIYTTLRVRFTLYAADGSSVQVTTVGEAMDSGDKSANKAMSAAMKYALIQLFCIPTAGDNDTENETFTVQPRQNGRHRDGQSNNGRRKLPTLNDVTAILLDRGLDQRTAAMVTAELRRRCGGDPSPNDIEAMIRDAGEGVFDGGRVPEPAGV